MESIEFSVPVVSIVDTIPEHLRELSRTLRPEDENELIAFGLLPQQALWRSYKSSLYAKTAIVDGKVAACWGCSGVFMSGQVSPWLLTSHQIKKVSPLRIARDYGREVYKMLDMFYKLENYVDSRYTAAIRLLDIVGFTFGEPEPMGINGEKFIKFWMEK